MENFENDLLDMTCNVKFRKVNNEFQNKMKTDINSVGKSKKAFIPADKTRNIMYEMEKTDYEKLLNENISKSYKKANARTLSDINSEAKNIATKLGIHDRATTFAKNQSFIILKDHKQNFQNAPK